MRRLRAKKNMKKNFFLFVFRKTSLHLRCDSEVIFCLPMSRKDTFQVYFAVFL